MSRKIPEPIRAVAGLAVTFLDEARRLPSTIPGLPVRFLSLAMQATMKMQQQYAGLVARGDELFTGLRGRHEPGLATFDEDLPVEEPVRSVRSSAFDRATVPDESRDAQIAEKAADDELLGLPPEVAPEEVVASVHDITEQVREATVEVTAAPSTADLGLSTEDALESALLEAESAPSDGGLVDRDLLAESLPGEDVTADVSTEVDVLTPAGEVATVEGTVTDEGVAAPEAPAQETGRRRAAAARAGAVTAQEAAVDEALGSGDEVRAGSRGAAPAPTATVSDDHEHTGEGDEVVTRGGAAVDDALGSDDGSPAAGREVVTEPEAAVEEALGAQAGEEQRAAASPTPGRAAAADDHEATGQGAEVVTGAA
ncbi:MAG TPA: hypothetical protein VHF92_03530, partial [Geodermatophilus sp.]|nr:hypothetical protein [Geodermatophilus sp.]